MADKEPAGSQDDPTPADDLVDPTTADPTEPTERGHSRSRPAKSSWPRATRSGALGTRCRATGNPSASVPPGSEPRRRPRRREPPDGAEPEAKGRPTRKRDGREPAKHRTGPVTFVRESVGELRKVVYPTGPQLLKYFVVVLIFVLFVIAYVSLLDLGFGAAMFRIFA